MATRTISTGEALRFGWKTMKNNLGFFIILLLASGILQNAADILSRLIREPAADYLFQLAGAALSTVVSIGLIKVSLKFCDNRPGELRDLLVHYRFFFKFLTGYILYGLIVLAGLLLFIVPGIIWSIKFFFFDYFVIDRDYGPIKALKASSEITRGVKLDLFGFFIVLVGINILGLLFLVVGLFATVPTSMVATAFVYRQLASGTEISGKSNGIETPDIPNRETSWKAPKFD